MHPYPLTEFFSQARQGVIHKKVGAVPKRSARAAQKG
jgi:1,2-phenylacetyl-CoA epoxidase PaaB subunit